MKLMNNYKLGKPCLSKIYLSLLLIGCVCVCAHTYTHVNEGKQGRVHGSQGHEILLELELQAFVNCPV